MTLEQQYYVTFGPGDSSDTLDWEVELTPEEEAAMMEAKHTGEELEDVLADAISRAYDEIAAQEEENMKDLDMEWSDGWSLTVEVVYPDDFYDEEEE